MPYPSCPKSSLNFSNFAKSSSLTVGLDVAIERSISFCKIIKNIPTKPLHECKKCFTHVHHIKENE